MKRWLLVAVLVLAGCDGGGRQVSKTTPSGTYVQQVFMVDANTGRCVRFWRFGKVTSLEVVDSRYCKGDNLPNHKK
jgi:hypothetical protein